MASMSNRGESEKQLDSGSKDINEESLSAIERENNAGEKGEYNRNDAAQIGSVVQSDERNMDVLLMKDYEIILKQKEMKQEATGPVKTKYKEVSPAKEVTCEEEGVKKKLKLNQTVASKEFDENAAPLDGEHDNVMEANVKTVQSEELNTLQESVNVDRANSVVESLEPEAMEVDKNADEHAEKKSELQGEKEKPQENAFESLEHAVIKNAEILAKDAPTIDPKQVMGVGETTTTPIKVVASKSQPIQLKTQQIANTDLQSQQQMVQTHAQYIPEGANTYSVIGGSKQVNKPAKISSSPQMKVQQSNKPTQPIKILDQVQQSNQQIHKQELGQQQKQSPKSFTNSVQASVVKANATTNSTQLSALAIKSGDSLLNNNSTTKTKFKSTNEEDAKWHTVGIFNGLTTAVSSYIDNSVWSSRGLDLTTDNLPDLMNFKRVSLEPGTAYRFRLRAINSVGASEWGEVSSFKTCLPGFPGAPSAIKISKSPDGAHLTWEPPPTSRDSNEIVEYSVYLAVKPARDTKEGKSMLAMGGRTPAQLAFLRVYVGPVNQCVVSQVSLLSAHVDCTNKPAIIFRIAARNEKGYGPATQVRWLQDAGMTTATTNANNMNPATGPRVKAESMAANTAFKRYKTSDVRYSGSAATNNE